MCVAEIRRLKQLEEQNSKLKYLGADLTFDMGTLQDVLRKSVETCTPSRHCLPPAGGLCDLKEASLSGDGLWANVASLPIAL